MNWVMGATPVSAVGAGRSPACAPDPVRQHLRPHVGVLRVSRRRPGPPDVRQWNDCANRNTNRVIGTLGETDNRRNILGENPWEYEPSEDQRKSEARCTSTSS